MAVTKMNEEYFSGSQASIFIGDVWVDDILDWQCSVGANSIPIYGYGSTFYDRAVQGRVLVQGSFTINFREPNYLFAILARYNEFNNLEMSKNHNTISFSDPRDKSGLLENNRIQEMTYLDKRQVLDTFFEMKNPKDTQLGSVFNTIRGASEIRPDARENSIGANAGEFNNKFAIPTFDIKIGYGSTLDENTIGEKIFGVKLVGKGKIITANGEPIKETYNFFARNLA